MLAFSLLALLGCPRGPDDTATPAEPFDCALGLPTAEGWQPITDELEMTLGFQGFLLLVLQARADSDAPETVDAAMMLTLDGEDPISGAQPAVVMEPDAEGRQSEPILLFLTSNYPSWYEGRQAELTVRLSAPGQVCTVQLEGTMVDEDPCVHTGDVPECPEDTGP